MFASLRRSLANAGRIFSFTGHHNRTPLEGNKPSNTQYENFLSSYCTTTIDEMAKSALVILAPGAEEMEFVIATDLLRRAGVKVVVAGLCGTEPVKGSRDIVFVPDTSLESAATETFDVVVLPGGLGGAKAMAESQAVGALLKTQEENSRLIAAICAAPTALLAHGIGSGKSLTSYPMFKEQLSEKYRYVDDKNVVVDGNLITSRGPATAFDFGLKIAEILAGAEKTQELSKALLIT